MSLCQTRLPDRKISRPLCISCLDARNTSPILRKTSLSQSTQHPITMATSSASWMEFEPMRIPRPKLLMRSSFRIAQPEAQKPAAEVAPMDTSCGESSSQCTSGKFDKSRVDQSRASTKNWHCIDTEWFRNELRNVFEYRKSIFILKFLHHLI